MYICNLESLFDMFIMFIILWVSENCGFCWVEKIDCFFFVLIRFLKVLVEKFRKEKLKNKNWKVKL